MYPNEPYSHQTDEAIDSAKLNNFFSADVSLNRNIILGAFCKKGALNPLSTNFLSLVAASVSKMLFNKVAALKRLWHRCFFVNFANFLRIP